VEKRVSAFVKYTVFEQYTGIIYQYYMFIPGIFRQNIPFFPSLLIRKVRLYRYKVLYRCYNTQNQPGNKAKTSARHKGEHAAPSSPDSESKKPTTTLFRTTVVRGPGQAVPEANPTRPSQHPNRRPIQEIITRIKASSWRLASQTSIYGAAILV
jgi:hypothetical protein